MSAQVDMLSFVASLVTVAMVASVFFFDFWLTSAQKGSSNCKALPEKRVDFLQE